MKSSKRETKSSKNLIRLSQNSQSSDSHRTHSLSVSSPSSRSLAASPLQASYSIASSPMIQLSPLTTNNSNEMLASKLSSPFPLIPSSSHPSSSYVPALPFGPFFQYPHCMLPGQEGRLCLHHQHPKVSQTCSSSSNKNVTQTAAAKRRNRRKRNMHRKIEYAQLVALTAASLIECSPSVEPGPSHNNSNHMFVHPNHQSNRNPFYNYHNASSTFKIKSCLRYVSFSCLFTFHNTNY